MYWRVTYKNHQELFYQNSLSKCNPNAIMQRSRWLGRNAISGHFRHFCLFFVCFFSKLPDENRKLSKLCIYPWMNQMGCEPLKVNNESWRGEMWTPLTWVCIELLVVTDHVLYMWCAPRKHVWCNFLNDEWIQNLEISILFMLAFHQLRTTEVECLRICKHWNN